MLLMITCPDGPEGAEWKTTPILHVREKDESPRQYPMDKVPARMEDMFGNPYLTERIGGYEVNGDILSQLYALFSENYSQTSFSLAT